MNREETDHTRATLTRNPKLSTRFPTSVSSLCKRVFCFCAAAAAAAAVGPPPPPAPPPMPTPPLFISNNYSLIILYDSTRKKTSILIKARRTKHKLNTAWIIRYSIQSSLFHCATKLWHFMNQIKFSSVLIL